jgi:hypothetical protein
MEPGTARSAPRADRAGGSPGPAGRRRPPRLPRSTCHKSRPGNSRHVTPATGAAVPTRADRRHVLPGPTPAGRCRAVLPRLYMLGDLAGAGARHGACPHQHGSVTCGSAGSPGDAGCPATAGPAAACPGGRARHPLEAPESGERENATGQVLTVGVSFPSGARENGDPLRVQPPEPRNGSRQGAPATHGASGLLAEWEENEQAGARPLAAEAADG